MFPVNPVTFELNTGGEELLLGEEELLEGFTDASFGAVFGWTPVTPGPPPIYTARLSNAFVTRAPIRSAPQIEGMPVKQDPRQTRHTEQVEGILNALLRRVEIIRVGVKDFRLSWIPPQMAGVDAPIGTLFLDTSTGFLSLKDINGVVIPIGSGGSLVSLDFGGP